jgi:hypothetical protein
MGRLVQNGGATAADAVPEDRAIATARIFFDVDDTLVTWNWKLRPLTREVLAELTRLDFEVFLWSGRGRRWEVVDLFSLQTFVRGCFEKPLFRHRERLVELGVPFAPDFVVDDHVEVVDAFGGFCIPVPAEPLAEDRHLLAALHAIQDRFGLARTAL